MLYVYYECREEELHGIRSVSFVYPGAKPPRVVLSLASDPEEKNTPTERRDDLSSYLNVTLPLCTVL